MTALNARPTTVFRSPDDLTATEPPERRGLDRDQVRLLVATPAGITHTRFDAIGDHLDAGDLLVVNNSATRAAEFDATDADGDPVVVHVATGLDNGEWVVELRTAPDAAKPILDAPPGIPAGRAGGYRAHLAAVPTREPNSSPTGSGNRLWRSAFEGTDNLASLLPAIGRPIAYGYLRDRFPLTNYQTVFARWTAAPRCPARHARSARELVARLVARGIRFAPITLHTGVSSQDAGEAPQPEWRRSARRPRTWSTPPARSAGGSSRSAPRWPVRWSRASRATAR